MRKVLPARLEAARIEGIGGSGNGGFEIKGPCGEMLRIIASAWQLDPTISQGWDHVSVSRPRITPNWREMCFVKDLFFEEEETVIQFHPPHSQYVNNHLLVLHLWRHKDGHMLPPAELVGDKRLGELTRDEAMALTLGHRIRRNQS
jgi:hypothetical protein